MWWPRRRRNKPAGPPAFVRCITRLLRQCGLRTADNRPLGRKGEDAAARYLKKQGYRILERNRYLGKNEIDIIAQEGDTIAFVEVRTRKVLDGVPPEDSVGPAKRRQLRRAAQRYIGLHGDESLYYRFDIVAVIMPADGQPSITLYRDAFGG